MKKILKKISDAKDWLVKDNVGLHYALAYIAYDVSVKHNFLIAITGVMLGIVLMEVYDKVHLKTSFSWRDILAGLLGLATAYFINI